MPLNKETKLKYLAYLPVDHLAHPVVSCRILLLCQFAALAYYGFIFVTAEPTLAILLRLLLSLLLLVEVVVAVFSFLVYLYLLWSSGRN